MVLNVHIYKQEGLLGTERRRLGWGGVGGRSMEVGEEGDYIVVVKYQRHLNKE